MQQYMHACRLIYFMYNITLWAVTGSHAFYSEHHGTLN